MQKVSWFALALIVSPLGAVAALAVLHPLGDPQDSASPPVRMLDFQATYWLRHALPVPPPLLVAGLLLALVAWWRARGAPALVACLAGILLLVLWALVMLVPLLVHVN